jgi:AraC-like DNA-binding protein
MKEAAPVAEIAEQAGYGEPEHMTAMFQRKSPITPQRYRKDMRSR